MWGEISEGLDIFRRLLLVYRFPCPRQIASLCPPCGKTAPRPPASSVKGVRFASVNANYAPLTARAARRRGPLGRAFVLLGSGTRCQGGQKTHPILRKKGKK